MAQKEAEAERLRQLIIDITQRTTAGGLPLTSVDIVIQHLPEPDKDKVTKKMVRTVIKNDMNMSYRRAVALAP